MSAVAFSDPADLARHVTRLDRPLLIGLDVDGVLAPIVPHADDARLSPGVAELLDQLDGVDGVEVAVVSSRSLHGLARFPFSPAITVVGSHGGEMSEGGPPALDPTEQARYHQIDRFAGDAAAAAGPGAWVEHKPLSVVFHVRQADPMRGSEALERLHTEVGGLDGVKAIAGSKVLEIFARPASKGDAIEMLRRRHEPASMVYAGDDVTDEEAFAALGPADCSVKVGPGDTAAAHRLADPDAVVDWLHGIAAELAEGK